MAPAPTPHAPAERELLHLTRMDFIDRRPADPDRPQAAYRRAVRLARIADRYTRPYARSAISIHRHDFLGEGTEYLSFAATDLLNGSEAHLTVILRVDECGRARPHGGTLTLKGLGDDAVWWLVGALSPLAAPLPPEHVWQPRGSWWKRHRFLNPGAWHDSLQCETESHSAAAMTGNGCPVFLYLEGCSHQLNTQMGGLGPEVRTEEIQLATLMRLLARWGALSATRSAYVRGVPSPLPL